MLVGYLMAHLCILNLSVETKMHASHHPQQQMDRVVITSTGASFLEGIFSLLGTSQDSKHDVRQCAITLPRTLTPATPCTASPEQHAPRHECKRP